LQQNQVNSILIDKSVGIYNAFIEFYVSFIRKIEKNLFGWVSQQAGRGDCLFAMPLLYLVYVTVYSLPLIGGELGRGWKRYARNYSNLPPIMLGYRYFTLPQPFQRKGSLPRWRGVNDY
jgi:hypothetical protein